MNCAEFQRVLPEIIDDGNSLEQASHLRSCSACSSLVSDLHAISTQARTLQASEEPSPRVWEAIDRSLQEWQTDLEYIAEQAQTLQASEEPSPRVWNSLEIALRKEGLIRQPQRAHSVVSFFERWRMAWIVPVAAALLVAGVLMVQQADQGGAGTVGRLTSPGGVRNAEKMTPSPDANEDQQVLEAVASSMPAMRATYEANLQNVNASIQEAKQSAEANPDDEEAQESLMSAYEQKAMIYDMALDRSLP
jgi:hypothetical protein